MAISLTELNAHRAVTLAFINSDSFSCTLTRRTKTADGAGGYVFSDTTLSPQTMRLIPLGDGASERIGEDGKAVRPGYMLMGRWDADMAREDTFTKDGRQYRIVFINDNVQYEKKGEVVYVG